MQPRLGRWPWVALGMVAACLLPGVASGAPKRPPIEVVNVRAGFSNSSENNLFKIGAWTPVWVQLQAGDQRFQGFMDLVVPDDKGTSTTVHQPIDLGPGESQRYTTYTRPGTNDPDFEIRLVDASRRVRPIRVNGSAMTRFDALASDVTLLLTLGNAQGVDQIPSLPGFSADKDQGESGIHVARVDAAGGYLPGRWYGYDAARVVVLDTNDSATLMKLDSLQGRALIDWVRRGGHLVVSVGANWQKVRDSVLGPILPAVPTGQERINDLGALESFVGGSTKPISPPGSPAVMVAKLEDVEERGGRVLSRGLGVPLIVRGSHGFGRVTVIALDIDQKPFAGWEDKPLFWVRALDLRRPGGESAGAAVQPLRGPGRMYRSGFSDLSSRLRQALEQFQGVKLVSFGWVAFFIFLYILLIGPGDYLFLKKVLKRMELTWVTFPLIVVTVSLLAYYAAYVVKGNELRVNKVDIVDVLLPPGPDNAVPPSGLVRGSTFLDIFSPQNRDYAMSIVPIRLDQEVPAGAEAPAQVPAGTEVILSWFGVPEAGFGGMGNSGQMSFSGGGYEYLPPGGAEKLDGVRIAIWSTQCLTGRWFAPGPATPLIEADLRPVGPDRLEGTVTNRSGMPLHDAIVAYNKQVYLVGTIAPGATLRVELSQDRQLSGHLRSKTQNYLPAQPYARQGDMIRINRADLLLELMFHDATTTSAVSETSLSSNVLHDLDLTGLLHLDRPMLVARIDRPTSRLVLENAPSTPKIEQTTLLRVVLPLKTPEGEAAQRAKKP